MPHDNFARFEFTNAYGEHWQVVIDSQARTGVLRGDETAWQPVEIRDDRVQGGFGLNREEFEWLSKVWRQTTGEQLGPTFLQRVERVLQAMSGDFRRN